MADLRVQEVQQWLNDAFPSYFKYDATGQTSGSFPVKPDGKTGNTTVKALVMAIQIHYGLTPVDGIWGNATSSACPTIDSSVTDPIILKIAQGGFYCKGYDPNGFDGIWGPGLASAINDFKTNLGITPGSTMNDDVFKSLLTTDPSVLTADGDATIRSLQQYLNGNYFNLFKSSLGYIPTGGTFDRKTSKALIFALQNEIGTTADGILGNNTFKLMPTISVGCTQIPIVKILQGALACNGYPAGFDGVYDETVRNKVSEFQEFMLLDTDPLVTLGSVNRRTWCALLWSKGDPERTPNACDCRTKIEDPNVAVELYNRGFRYIGRYLTSVPEGYDKALTIEEAQILLDAGLKIFPIFQESPSTPVPSDFTKEARKTDATKALTAALSLGLKAGTTIYFALDCDMTEAQVNTYAIPYFNGLHETLDTLGYYNIGVYGARNSCTKIQNLYPGTKCFVSNMSTGYSGNLGFRMPENWAFDQYTEIDNYSIAGTTFDLDYDMASGIDTGVDTLLSSPYAPPYNPDVDEVPESEHILNLISAIRWLEEQFYAGYNITSPTHEEMIDCAKGVCDYLSQYMYTDYNWGVISPKDPWFTEYINYHYSTDEHVEFLYPYMYYHEEGEDENKIVYRTKLLTDEKLGFFELPHLAIVIKCYLYCLVESDWAAWAGDFATGIKDVYVNSPGSDMASLLEIAKNLIGEMEPSVADITQVRQFNYCDFIADLDGYKIAKMIEEYTSSPYGLSECIKAYYEDLNKYHKRYQYFKELLGFETWNIDSIAQVLTDYINSLDNAALVLFFCRDMKNNPGSDRATARITAMYILFWANYTGVI